MPNVTLYEKVKPRDAASGSVGLASGIAIRWTAGTAIYDAAPQRTINRTYGPISNGRPRIRLYVCATVRPIVANIVGAMRPNATNCQPPAMRSRSFFEAVIPI